MSIKNFLDKLIHKMLMRKLQKEIQVIANKANKQRQGNKIKLESNQAPWDVDVVQYSIESKKEINSAT